MASRGAGVFLRRHAFPEHDKLAFDIDRCLSLAWNSQMTGDRYYVDHEIAYALLRKKGEVGWQKKTLSEFRSPDTESILRPLIARYVPQISRRTALDLGCGSGPTAHFLAELGFTT